MECGPRRAMSGAASVLDMSMSLGGYTAGPNDEPGNPGADRFMRLRLIRGITAPGHRPSRRPGHYPGKAATAAAAP